jgi:hypothetical protein
VFKVSTASGLLRFCDAGLEWLRGREHHLLGERRKLFGLLGQRFELLALCSVESSTNTEGDFTPDNFCTKS